jgi:hypothetical protein
LKTSTFLGNRFSVGRRGLDGIGEADPACPRFTPAFSQFHREFADQNNVNLRFRHCRVKRLLGSLLSTSLSMLWAFTLLASDIPVPVPLLGNGQPVDWWFAFKFNAGSFPECGGAQRECPFGGTPQPYSTYGQQFAFASSADSTLRQGAGCIGETTADPVGATFNQVYNGNFFYVLWNDQFYGDPLQNQYAPAGHSKGMLAWNSEGNGMLMQVSTPSWPASGSSNQPRQTDGNTLGCAADNDVLVSQHFFALRLNQADLVMVLEALANASVVTDPTNLQIVSNGGPANIQALVSGLGKISSSTTATRAELASGVLVISKPSALNVPPWQMVSALLYAEPLRVASWWAAPEIPTTSAATPVACWNQSLGKPGAVEIATTGAWQGTALGFEGVAEPDGNHAKIGVSAFEGRLGGVGHAYVISGDLNQSGTLSGPYCGSSQNGRGGLFFVIPNNPQLFLSVHDLLQGETAPQ